MTKAVYDTDDNGIVDNAESVNGVNIPLNVAVPGSVLTSGVDGVATWEVPSVSGPYDVTYNYAIGDIISYEGVVYSSIAGNIAGPWDETQWINQTTNIFDQNRTYDIGDLIYDPSTTNGRVIHCTTVPTLGNVYLPSDWEEISITGGTY